MINEAIRGDSGVVRHFIHLLALTRNDSSLPAIIDVWNDLFGPASLAIGLWIWQRPASLRRGLLWFCGLALLDCAAVIVAWRHMRVLQGAGFVDLSALMGLGEDISPYLIFAWFVLHGSKRLRHPLRTLIALLLVAPGLCRLAYTLENWNWVSKYMVPRILAGNTLVFFEVARGPFEILLSVMVLASRTTRRWAGWLAALVVLFPEIETALWILKWGGVAALIENRETQYGNILALAVLLLLLPRYFSREDRLAQPDWACKSCGYNLTGNLSGVCPECGTGVGGEDALSVES